MPASEETDSGPVIHDNRRIDPVSGQVRGKHAASKPAGTTKASPALISCFSPVIDSMRTRPSISTQNSCSV